jgi:hypothetical protein
MEAGTRRESGADLQGIGQTWNDLASPVILIDHHQFESDETWARFERDTNVYRWRAIKDLIEFQVSFDTIRSLLTLYL